MFERLSPFECEGAAPCHTSTDGLTPRAWPVEEYRTEAVDPFEGPSSVPLFPPDWPERGILS